MCELRIEKRHYFCQIRQFFSIWAYLVVWVKFLIGWRSNVILVINSHIRPNFSFRSRSQYIQSPTNIRYAVQLGDTCATQSVSETNQFNRTHQVPSRSRSCSASSFSNRFIRPDSTSALLLSGLEGGSVKVGGGMGSAMPPLVLRRAAMRVR